MQKYVQYLSFSFVESAGSNRLADSWVLIGRRSEVSTFPFVLRVRLCGLGVRFRFFYVGAVTSTGVTESVSFFLLYLYRGYSMSVVARPSPLCSPCSHSKVFFPVHPPVDCS
jgi:hypothetical protein